MNNTHLDTGVVWTETAVRKAWWDSILGIGVTEESGAQDGPTAPVAADAA